MLFSQPAAAGKRALADNIKQAIQGLFTAGTSPERKRSVAKRGLKASVRVFTNRYG